LYDRVRQAGEWATSRGADLIIRAALDEKLVSVPGKQTVYSDLGFIALGRLLEERLGDRLDVLCADQFNRYYGDTDLAFNAKRAHTAPTTVSGAVDDMNCRAMGGVAGHAGLFGTLNSVERACEFFLRALQGNNLGVSAILRGFARYNSERPLGFDRPTPSGSTGGWLSEQSVGHLGSTGTSLWIDPAIGAIYVLLTNRMHFEDRDASGIKALRIQFHETAVNWLNETAAAENLRCQ
jgi:CubicO group peptidase (beta-lactamase class C family)